ncbi:endonuclease III domain-containing protein [Hydrogenothermus marinus]|uniref:endonuclease III domain-containing protein n=1 Tax=Hydrogenothermus marinus TaxID=133270 RepID=UPI000EF9C00E|nr:endonuclease [Hydrogenothermus marinus]
MEVKQLYETLLKNYGYQNWWPLTGKFEPFEEICIGAILTQNTNWNNVEKALNNLILNNITSFEKIEKISEENLSKLIKPSGFYNQKAKTLKRFVKKVLSIKKENIDRDFLLSIKGIGKETADTILLYGLNKPIFIVDAYTKRLFYRVGLIKNEKIDYDFLRHFIEKNIKKDTNIYKEFHALIVKHCKDMCRKNPNCENCFLNEKCSYFKL